MDELETVLHETCEMQVPGGVENSYGKVNILLQSFVSRQHLESFSLVSDQSYVAQVIIDSNFIMFSRQESYYFRYLFYFLSYYKQ